VEGGKKKKKQRRQQVKAKGSFALVGVNDLGHSGYFFSFYASRRSLLYLIKLCYLVYPRVLLNI
jgi:hypothetical protein